MQNRWFPILLTFALAGSLQVSAQELDPNRPYSGEYQPPDDELPAASPLISGHPQILSPTTKLFRDTTIVDFEKRQVTVVRIDSLGFIVWTHHYGELNEYVNERSWAAMEDAWHHGGLYGSTDSTQNKQHDLKLAWELPVQYPGWAQRVLGNDPPRLSINGSLKITMSYENKQQKQSSAMLQSQSTGPGFVFDEQNQFTVSGSVGRLININISSNSQGDVDVNNPLKNFKIDYKESKPGELEDEVVQQVTAGYTSFDMPGTQLSGFSESHEGLFGIKIASRFGPLSLTTIASNEQGESQKLSVNNSGASGSGMTLLKESDFKKFSTYFLDTAYIHHYNKKNALVNGNSLVALDPGLVVDTVEIWQSIDGNTASNLLKNDPSRRVHQFSFTTYKNGGKDSTADMQLFVRLEKDRQYTLYPNDGYIHFSDTAVSPAITEPSIIGIYLRTKGHTLKKGGDRIGDSLYPSSLWVLKASSDATDSLLGIPDRYPLMWRNVYPLPSTIGDLSSFQLNVYRITKDNNGDTAKTVLNNVLIGDAMGLTKNGTPQISRQDIFNFNGKELVVPPYDTSVIGNQPFANPGLKRPDGTDMRDSLIYRYGPGTQFMLNNYFASFTLGMSGSSKQTVFDLGIGVMDKSVRVMADGKQLQADVDYSFNVDAGKLELTSPAAKAASKIEIDYQREAMFMPEKTLFMGARAEMALPFLSDKSLVGLSVLYQSTSIAQDIPRINQEPYSKLLFDFNAHLDFQPGWMTTLINKLPLINTTAPSTATVDFEIAHSMMNPNTANQAYIDDFESSKQVYALGQGYKSWFRASPPYFKDSLVRYPPAWDWYWFTPVYNDNLNGVLRDSVWVPEAGQVYTGTDKYETVLRLHTQPGPHDATLAGRFSHAWAGIMTPVPLSMANRVSDQYFEILVKAPQGAAGRGRLRIQMGSMNEDLCIDGAPPNGVLDKEDTSTIWRENHDPALDRGLDGKVDAEETYLIPNLDGTGYDTLKYGDSRLEEWSKDPGKDDYQLYDENNAGGVRYKYACRQENDGWATASEDLLNDGSFNPTLNEQYHEFIINLADTLSPFVDTTAKLVPKSNWHRYRLPLHVTGIGIPDSLRHEVGGMGTDDWSNIRMVRLIWDGIDSSKLTEESQLILDGMQFVGNQWESIKDSLGNSNVDVSTIGTTESQVYEASLKTTNLIHRQLDQSNVLQAEQSLLLSFHDVGRGQTALAQKSLINQPLSVAAYDSMTMAVYGVLPEGYPGSGALYNGKVHFVFRFGTDSSTYYEYRRTIQPAWNNYVCINLKNLSNLKLAWFTNKNHPQDSAIDTIDETGTLRIKAPAGNRQPNFANITWMAVGVICDSIDSTTTVLGQIWVDELKVLGIQSANGWSSRLSVATQWADVLNLSADVNYTGGNFKTMTDTKTSLGDSKLSDDVHISTGLDKFMPKSWGVSIPVGGTITSSLTRPQLMPSTDIYLTDNQGQPDNFLEMATAMINRAAGRDMLKSPLTSSTAFETYSYSQSLFANYSKANTSTNPAVDFLLQRLSTSFNYSMSTNQTRKGKIRTDSDSDYVDLDSSHTYSGSVNYDLSPRTSPSWTKWKPFGTTAPKWLPTHLKDVEFDLLPSKIGLNVANVNYSTQIQRQFEPTVQCSTATKDLKLDQGIQIDYAPIRPVMDLSYSLSVSRDFPNDSTLGKSRSVFNLLGDDILKRNSDPLWHDYYILQNEQSRSQNFKATLNPQLFDWLTNSADYSANFSGQLTKYGSDSTKNYMNAKVNSGVNFNGGLTLAPLFQSLTGMKGVGKVAGVMKSGFDLIGFNSVNFTYSSTAALTNNNLGADFLSSQNINFSNFMGYQLGLGGRSLSDIISGTMNDQSALGGMRYRSGHGDLNDFYQNDTRAVNQTYQLSTSLALPKAIDLQLSSISLKWNRQYSLRPDTTFYDTTWTYPDLSVTAQSHVLDKVAIVSKYVQGANLSSGFSLRKTAEMSSSLPGAKSTTAVVDLSPLVSIDGTVKKWPITFKYQHTMHREATQAGTDAKTVARDGDNLDMNYELQKSAGLSDLKIFKWTIPVRGRTTMGMALASDHSTTLVSGSVTDDVSNFTVTPHLSYIFTDNVTGTLQYTGARATQNGSITSTNTVSLIAEIKF